MSYHLAGAINAVLFVLSLAGVAAQLARIWQRRSQRADPSLDRPTAVLSLNYFSVSFLAYYAFFLYGYCIRPFNHYLVWPRLAGCLLLIAVLAEIARDRADRVATIAFAVALAFVAAGIAFLAFSPPVVLEARALPQGLSVVAAALIAQSLIHQIRLIRVSGHPGAVSRTLHLFTGTKDASTVAFGFAMGISTGWPLVLMGGSSAALKALLLYQFRWASRSPVAAVRRAERVVNKKRCSCPGHRAGQLW
jgi:hypothetical protein